MSDRLVIFNDVVRQYFVGSNIVDALKSVNCSVVAHQHVAVTGASGSGKSTLLAMIAGLDQPDSGEIEWPAFSDAYQLRPKYIGVSFQSPSLLPSLTVQQNVEVPLLVLGASDVAIMAGIALDRLGIENLRDRYPDEISQSQVR